MLNEDAIIKNYNVYILNVFIKSFDKKIYLRFRPDISEPVVKIDKTISTFVTSLPAFKTCIYLIVNIWNILYFNTVLFLRRKKIVYVNIYFIKQIPETLLWLFLKVPIIYTISSRNLNFTHNVSYLNFLVVDYDLSLTLSTIYMTVVAMRTTQTILLSSLIKYICFNVCSNQ